MQLTPIFVAIIIAGVVFFLAGIMILIFPPNKINNLYGYRTKNSMKSQSSWNFAQKFSGWEIIKSGIILFICSLVGLQFDFSQKFELLVGLSVLIVVVSIFLLRTEQAIKKHALTEKQL